MRLVGVDLKRVRVDSLSVVDDSVVLEMFFNDGYDKQIFKTVKVVNPKQTAEEIVNELMRMENNINVKFDGEKIKGNSKVVINDEESKIRGLTRFLEEVSAKMFRIKNKTSSTGYLDLLREIKGMEASL